MCRSQIKTSFNDYGHHFKLTYMVFSPLKATLYAMKKSALIASMLSFGLSGISIANQESWAPQPNFRIEDGNHRQTLIFVSGMAYALTASNQALKNQNKPNFFCVPGSGIIGSKLLIEILNTKLSGRVSSEAAIATVTEGLLERFPCQ